MILVSQMLFVEDYEMGLRNHDTDKYWTFWAVGWLGGAGVLLSIVQIVVGIVQVVKV